MKTATTVLLLCLTASFTARSQTISKDTAALLTADQLRTTALIFAEHAFLKSENALLLDEVSLLKRSGKAKDYVIGLQSEQISILRDISAKKDFMIMNGEAAIDALKEDMKAESRKHRKYFWAGAGAGAVVVTVLFVIFK